MGVQVSEAAARRQTEAAGAAYEAVQNEQASQLVEEEGKQEQEGSSQVVPASQEGKDQSPR